MKILHTADLHLGQIIYQNYDREDEHNHFFTQLEAWCKDEQPDALIVSGDVFDIQQPSAATKKDFTDHFVALHKACPEMKIVITAGNHDSAARIQADSAVWDLANATLVGTTPSAEVAAGPDGWQDKYIVKLDSGYIIAMPYTIGERQGMLQSILDRVAADNTDGKPVVMMGHLAVTGMDSTGHDFEVGKIKTQSLETLGTGYDYLALGHIHKPQTIGHLADFYESECTYPAPVVRYSGSALHVSCDEAYPHSVSLVSIDHHGGSVTVRQLPIDELRHFYTLPQDGSSYTTAEEALKGIEEFAQEKGRGYFRLQIDYKADLPANFSNSVYDLIALYGDEIRFNPKTIWTGQSEEEKEQERPTFEVADLQQMTDPFAFIEKTKDQYPGLNLDFVRKAFVQVKEEIEKKGDK